tara:strand:- start:174 stop:323 length:150 start_codon:yes stop_codon:yes gene_type:complete
MPCCCVQIALHYRILRLGIAFFIIGFFFLAVAVFFFGGRPTLLPYVPAP